MELLWEKEYDEHGSIYIDILKKVRKDYSIASRIVAEEKEFFKKLSKLWTNRKAYQVSLNYRQKGNIKFLQQSWMEAMNLYNQSLCFAEIGSENVTFAYSRRSACFFHMRMYEKCLKDIALAKEANYPDILLPQLEIREAECRERMKAVYWTDEFVPTLSFDGDANFPAMANILQIQRNDEFGRYVTANKDIDVGRTVLVEDAFFSSASSTESTRCHTCAKTAMNFIACEQCSYAMFCSSICMEKNNFHKVECKCHGLQLLDLPIQHLLRSIFIALNMFPNIEHLMDFVENAVASPSMEVPVKISDSKSKYRSILKVNAFMTSSQKKCFLPEICKLYSSLMCFPIIKELFDSKRKQRFLMHLLGQHICAINSNCYSNRDDQLSTFVIQSYFNHSCIPNLISFECGNKTIFTTIKPVAKGEQLFVFYLGYGMMDQSKETRNMNENFGFQCKCEKCLSGNNWNPIMPADPEYHHILMQFRQYEQAIVNNECKELCSELKSGCINLLRKYGTACRQFEIGPIEGIFGKLLEMEANRRLFF